MFSNPGSQLNESKNEALVRYTRKKICGMNPAEILQKAIQPPLLTLTKVFGQNQDLSEVIKMIFNEFEKIAREERLSQKNEGGEKEDVKMFLVEKDDQQQR